MEFISNLQPLLIDAFLLVLIVSLIKIVEMCSAMSRSFRLNEITSTFKLTYGSISEVVKVATLHTYQTYVKDLKKESKFGDNAKHNAMLYTKKLVMDQIYDNQLAVISTQFDNPEKMIEMMIESEVSKLH